MKIRSLLIVAVLAAGLSVTPMAWAAKGLVLVSPVGGDVWKAGSTCLIKWTGARYGKKSITKGGYGGKNVKIRLFKQGKFDQRIKNSTKNDGRYRWKIPSDVKIGKKVYTIRISGSRTTTSTDKSGKFSFKSKGVKGC
jgi:hypothetical protein